VSVTGIDCHGGEPINNRNGADREGEGLVAVRNIRNLKGEVVLTFRFPNADAAKCQKCGRDIGRAEAVYRSPNENRTRVRCEDCAQALRPDRGDWVRAACECCERPVVFKVDRRSRLHVFCSMLCEWSSYNRQRSERNARAREKVCEGCGEAFTATRRDAKTCSAACKQKVYRLRKKGGAA
jgi:hypothetical protein